MEIPISKLADEIGRQANRVISDAVTRRRHPTYITKPIGRDHVSRLHGAYEVLNVVLQGNVPERLTERVQFAYAEANTWLGKGSK